LHRIINISNVCLFCPIFILLSRESDGGDFGRIGTRLGVVHFRVFRLFLWLLITQFAACSKPPSRDNHRKAPYSRTQQRVRWGWEVEPRSRGHAADWIWFELRCFVALLTV